MRFSQAEGEQVANANSWISSFPHPPPPPSTLHPPLTAPVSARQPVSVVVPQLRRPTLSPLRLRSEAKGMRHQRESLLKLIKITDGTKIAQVCPIGFQQPLI